MKTILCIGAGYVGGPTMAVIAKHCPDYKVIVADIDHAKIAAWQSGNPPIYEPGLKDIVALTLDRNLFFTTDITQGIRDADIIFVSINTPTKTFGRGANKAADLQYWEKTARQILRDAPRDKIVVEKSTLPVRTAAAMSRILHPDDQGIHFEVLSNPEFLAEGTAIQDLEQPDRVLIGGAETERGQAAVAALVELYLHWVPRERILTTSVWSSELSKLSANVFLAQRVSSINSISAVCEVTGANIEEVAEAIGTDHRIGPDFLRPGVGFGGSCFRKDILNLVYLAETYGLTEVAEYWQQVVELNDYQGYRFVGRILSAMFNSVAGKRTAILGFAFKGNTGDTRDSPAARICRQLLEEKAEVVITDPQALSSARKDLAAWNESQLRFEEDPYAACQRAHAVLVLTDWDQYRSLDFVRIFEHMEKPAFLFDGRNILDHRNLHEIGFNVYPIGKPPLTRFDDTP
jgi:UDPglucose 6-dehydrogenase